MASTRSPSPTSDASTPTSPQLTPRSKLQAELAALDESSGDEATSPVKRKTLFASSEKTIIRSDEPSQENSRHDDQVEDDEEEDVVRPRGRLAARMHAENAEDHTKNSSSPHIVPETLKKSTQKTQDSDEDTDADAASPGDDDEDVSAAPRRRRIRLARSATPDVIIDREDSPASPGLFVSPSPRKADALHHTAAGSDDEDELPADLGKSSRFQALVARKREERLAKETEESRKRDERLKRMTEEMSDADDDDDVSDISDDAGGRKLTQEVARPKARKASKKALEEMNRETQRLSRSLQLAHEAKTKKKISKSTLFERFNFKPAGSEALVEILLTSDAKLTSSSRPGTPVSAAQTDAEMGEVGTPPSSPPSVLKKIANSPAAVAEAQGQLEDMVEDDENGELPSLEDALAQAQAQTKKLDKGKGKETLADLESSSRKSPSAKQAKPRRQVRVKLPPPVQANMVTIDSDDELQITDPKKQSRIDAIFSRAPTLQTNQSRSMHTLRQLAHVSSPPQDARKKNKATKPSMTVGELQLSLQQRARAQAKLERERRLDALKAKGVVVQTEEEREKEREQVEDIVTRARQEAEEIMARERDEAKKAKKERQENGEGDHLDWDDSDDDSFKGSDEEEEGGEVEDAEIIFSGSDEGGDEETGEEDGEGEEDEDEPAGNPMFDEDAEEADESAEEKTPLAAADVTNLNADEDEDMDVVQPSRVRSRHGKKNVQILSDDEEEQGAEVEATPRPKKAFPKSPSAPNSDSPKVHTSVLRSATKTFIPGLPVPAAGPAGMGLTQIFAGTMDDSQAPGSPAPASGSPLQFMPSFDNFPDSQFSATAGESQPADDMVLDSQTETQKRMETQTQGVQLNFQQSQMHGFDSLMQINGTQMSDMLNPTQDGGFAEYSPLKQRFVEPPQSRVDTVVLNGSPAVGVVEVEIDAQQMDSPLLRKRGKLRRRGEVSFAEIPPTAEIPGSPLVNPISTASDNEEPQQPDADEKALSAFKLMAKAARRKKRAQEKFDKKKSKANAMVEMQAEESEDEYAGLGGADGEDSSDDEGLEELREQMIDDKTEGMSEEDKGRLAAFFADRERAADSAQVDKLFRDITTGMLRKRRRGGGGTGNGDFDLSDSDDGGEARRRMKRRQFAKMQKALFADERIGKIAENPRNAAFLKSIEDRGSDEELDFEDHFEEEKIVEESQSQEKGLAEEHIPDSQPTAQTVQAENLGRKRMRTDPSEPAPRPAPHLRRTKDGKKPSSITDVRRSLSSLLEDRNGSFASIIPATDPGSDSEGEQQASTISSNKENRCPSSVAIVDRISLKRSGSSTISTGSSTSRLAFAAPSTSSGVFKVPALLRRATTNSSLISQTTSSTSTSASTANTGHHGGNSKGGSGFGEDAKLKKTAGKKSGVNFFARENERREKLQHAERKREERKWKGVEGRGKVVGGLFGGGRFE
ncbi:MRC1-like domain-containing protein [Xylariales sp. AK1849]|nr:MRC1-like domain-containing protein [Xylariales sp. AK1849]